MFWLQLVLQSSECECLWNVFLYLSGAPGSTPVAGFCLWGLRKDQGRQEENRFPSWAPDSTVVTCTHRGYRCNHIQCPSFMSDGGLVDPCCPFPGPAMLCRECPPAHSLAAGRGSRQGHQAGVCPCWCCLVQTAQTLPPGSLHTAWFSSVFLEASALCSSLGTFVLTFTQVYFGPHTTVLRLYYLIFSGQIAWSNEGAVLQSITAVLSVAGAEGQVLDGMRCAGPLQRALVFIIVFLHSLLQGLLQTKHYYSNIQPEFSGNRLFPLEYSGRKLPCIQRERSEATSSGAKQRVNHIDWVQSLVFIQEVK